MVVALVCGLGTISVIGDGWRSTDDGAGVVPVVSMVAIGLAGLRWRPEQRAAPVRPVSSRLAHLVNTAAAGLTTIVVARPELAGILVGPIMTLALFGAYLALWGYRALALLRTMTLLSLLTWQPVASFVHSVIRSSIQQPSDLLYSRLAQVPFLDLGDEPWRLFSAQLHRGALVVIATLALAIGSNRWRLSARTLVDLVLTVTAALTAHHLVILVSPIDQYAPTEMTRAATNPTLEIAISVASVVCLSAVRLRRDRADTVPAGTVPAGTVSAVHAESLVDDRDPVIFANVGRGTTSATTALLLTGLAPLIALAVIG